MNKQNKCSTVSVRRCAARCLYTAATLLIAATTAWACDSGKEYHVDLSSLGYGHVDQNDPNITNGEWACGPTSAINSFFFLQNHYGLKTLGPGNSLLTDANATDAINEIANPEYMNLHLVDPGDPTQGGGVDPNFFIKGKIDYLSDHKLSNHLTVEYQSIYQGGVIPTWTWLYRQLKAKQDVEIGFSWFDEDGGPSGGHIVTATSFCFADSDADGIIDSGEKAKMDFIDPDGGLHLWGDLEMMEGNFLKLTYSGGAAQEGDWGRIEFAVAESPIPEPSTYGLLAAACLICGIVVSRIRRKR